MANVNVKKATLSVFILVTVMMSSTVFGEFAASVSGDVGVSPTPTETPFADYAVTASAGPGGTIEPSGSFFAYPGSGFDFVITANPGYKIADVLVDGVSVGAISTYSFHDVQTSHEIVASFAPEANGSSFPSEYYAIVAAVIIAIVVAITVLLMKRKRSRPPPPPTSAS